MKRALTILSMACLMGLFAIQASAATLKIGSLSPLTGSEAADGKDIANGVKAAVEVIKAEGGIPGFDTIEVVSQDSACDPRQAVSGAEKLINEKVVGVVGAYCSSATIPASIPLNENKIIMITPASTNPQVTERKLPYMFRMCGRDDDQGPAAVKFMKSHLKAKTVFIVDDKTTYSQGLADKVSEVAKKEGIKVLAHEHVNKDDKDYSAVLTKIKSMKPDVFYMSLQNSSVGGPMAIQFKRLGLTAPIVAQDAVYHPQFIEIGQEAAQGVFLTFGFMDESTPAYKKFLDVYTKAFGKPGAYSAYAFDSAYVLLNAIKKAKSTDPDKIKAELMKTDLAGASKKIKFRANGDSGSNYIIYQVKGKEFIKFWDPETGKNF